MNKKLCSFILMGMLVSSSFTSLPVFAEDTTVNEQVEYQNFLADDSFKDFDSLVDEGAQVINEYDFINKLKNTDIQILKNRGMSFKEIKEIKDFSSEKMAKELSQLSYTDLADRGLTYLEIANLKKGIYNDSIIRKASSNIAFRTYKNWSKITGTPSNGTFKASMSIEYAFDNNSVLKFGGSAIMAFAWGYPCTIVKEQTTAKINYLPKQEAHEPGVPVTVRLNNVNSNSPNYGGYFAYDYHKYNYGSTYAGQGKAYIVMKNSYKGYREIEACGSLGTSFDSPWSVSLTIGPASISYSEGNHQLRNDFFRLD